MSLTKTTASALLTDDEILALEIEAGGTFAQGPVPFARAIESALLSKLRAPVADERAAHLKHFCLAFEAFSRASDSGEAYAELERAYEKARVALASAPVAGEAQTPTTEHFTPPFGNCSFRMCDLPGQCRGEGKCHHPSGAAPQASKPDFSGAYEGAREDLAIWKRRALAAERDLRTERETSSRLVAELNAQNGPMHMGEPAPQASKPQHSDDAAVDRFAVAMKAKLAAKRAAGRGGWDDKAQCSNAWLSSLLRQHLEKGDPVDVGNFAMMLHQRGERIIPYKDAPQASEAQCSCPSGDGSLRHPCAVHPQASEAVRDAEDAERWRWATASYGNADKLCSIVLCHGGYQEKINERADFYRAALSAQPGAQKGGGDA